MTMLLFSQLGAGGITFSPPVPLPTMNVYEVWHETFLPAVLRYSFLSRPICLITAQPQVWSLASELEGKQDLIVSSVPYSLAFMDSSSAELLCKVAESEDFNRGLLWLTSAQEVNEARSLISFMQKRGFVSTGDGSPLEVLTCNNDGESAYWLNPHLPLADIKNKLHQLAFAVGWSFVERQL